MSDNSVISTRVRLARNLRIFLSPASFHPKEWKRLLKK